MYFDFGVMIGNRIKIQNNVPVYHGVAIEDGVFIDPHACFCIDRFPRSVTPSRERKGAGDWTVGTVLVRLGASIGAGSVITPDVTIGAYALVGAGSIVTRSVPDHALVVGNPARISGYVCRCGAKLDRVAYEAGAIHGWCPSCRVEYRLPAEQR